MSQTHESELSKEDKTMRLLALTVFGVALEAIVGNAFILNAYDTLTFANFVSTSTSTTFIPAYTMPLLAVYVLLPVPYCWLASRSFKPKRIVSPLNIQIMSFTTIVVGYILINIIYVMNYSFANFNLVLFLDNVLSVGLSLGALLLFVGFFQDQVVRFLLGLNGTADDIDLKAWPVEVPFSEISDTLDSEFLHHYGLRLKKRDEKVLLLRLRTRDKRKVVLGFAPDPSDAFKSILAACGYGQGSYSIYRLDTASEMRDRAVKDLQYRLTENREGKSFFDKPLKETTDLASEEVRDFALEVTETGTSSLARVRRSILLTIGLPMAVLALLLVLWISGRVSTDLFGSSIVFYLFTLVTIYYPELKERVSKP